MAEGPRRVRVDERTYPVKLPTMDGTEEMVGQLMSYRYEGEGVMRHEFLGAGVLPENAVHLPPTTTDWKFIPHGDVVAPLIDRGWKMTKIQSLHGGLGMRTVMTHPDGQFIDDLVAWDYDLWPDRSNDGKIHEGLIITTDLRPRKTIQADWGFWRLVCTNGMTAKVLGLNAVRMRKHQFDAEALTRQLFEQNAFEAARGPRIGNRTGLRSLQDLLVRIEADDYSEDEVPFFMQSSLNNLTRLPRWFVSEFHLFLDRMYDIPAIHSLDMLNAVTGAVNHAQMAQPEARSYGRMSLKAEQISSTASNIMALYSLNN